MVSKTQRLSLYFWFGAVSGRQIHSLELSLEADAHSRLLSHQCAGVSPCVPRLAELVNLWVRLAGSKALL